MCMCPFVKIALPLLFPSAHPVSLPLLCVLHMSFLARLLFSLLSDSRSPLQTHLAVFLYALTGFYDLTLHHLLPSSVVEGHFLLPLLLFL